MKAQNFGFMPFDVQINPSPDYLDPTWQRTAFDQLSEYYEEFDYDDEYDRDKEFDRIADFIQNHKGLMHVSVNLNSTRRTADNGYVWFASRLAQAIQANPRIKDFKIWKSSAVSPG